MDWQWNEFQQVGTDYESVEEVACYDQRMRQMRDIDGEHRRVLAAWRLPADGTFLELGTDTGALVR